MITPSDADTCVSCFQPRGSGPACAACGFAEPARREVLLPYRHRLKKGRYLIGSVLGKPGGFGVAYKALDSEQGTLVVVKECLMTDAEDHVTREPDDPAVRVNPDFEDEYRRRIAAVRKEAMLIASFKSPYIVRVIDQFAEHNTHYYVMPFVEGSDLRQHLVDRGGTLPEAEVALMARKLLKALQEMHERKILHCDIKPSNVLITQRKRNPVLIDFGAARAAFVSEHSRFYEFSRRYAPPEQVTMSRNLGAWTDLYALCATLYECLTGQPPPPAADRQKARTDPYEPLPLRLPGVGPGLARLIDGGLALQPQDRLRDVAAAQAALGQETTSTEVHTPPHPPERLNPALLLLPGLLVLLWGLTATPSLPPWTLWFVGANVIACGAWWMLGKQAPAASNAAGPSTLVDDRPALGVELRFTAPGMATVVWTVEAGKSMDIGRSAKADITVPHPLVSSRHARIVVAENGEFDLKDLNSTNHVFVQSNGGGPWQRIDSAAGRRGRFMLGAPDDHGVLLEIRQTTVQP